MNVYRSLVLILLLPAITAAQQIRGVVVEDSTGLPIPGAKVELLAGDTTIRATTFANNYGWFELLPQGDGQFLLRASHPPYRNTATLAVTLGNLETITVVLRLTGGPIPIQPLVVKATPRDRMSGYRERLKNNAFGHFITRADLDQRGAYSLSHAMRFAPGVSIARVQDGAFVSEGVFMRSFGGACVPAVYLDGMQIPTGRIFDINDLISVEEVAGIEVYRSVLTAPMEFRLSALGSTPDSDGSEMWCGVIAVWSRPVPRIPLTPKRLFLAGLLVGGSVMLGRMFR